MSNTSLTPLGFRVEYKKKKGRKGESIDRDRKGYLIVRRSIQGS